MLAALKPCAYASIVQRGLFIGKASWEISKILGIAEATIIFHICNASRKLHTNTRTHAIARVIAMWVITS